MRLNIDKEVQKLSTKAKKLWSIQKEYIDQVSKEKKLNAEEKETITQIQLAALRIADLKDQNEYNRKNGDFFSNRAIKKNEVEMEKMKRIFNDNAKILGENKVEELYTKINALTAKEIQRQNELNNKKGR